MCVCWVPFRVEALKVIEVNLLVVILAKAFFFFFFFISFLFLASLEVCYSLSSLLGSVSSLH